MLHSRVATISEYGEVLATKDLSWDWIPTKHRPRPAPILKRPNRLAKIGREAGYRYLQPHAKNTDCLIGQERMFNFSYSYHSTFVPLEL